MGIINLIAGKNYITFNKPLAKIIGVNSAIVFGQLCSISLLNNDKEFFYQKDRIEEDTCLGEQAVRTAIQTLKDFRLISVIKKGIPCKYYYKINEEELSELLGVTTSDSSTDTTSDSSTDTTSDSSTDTTFKNNIKNNIKNKEISEQTDILDSYFDNCKKLYEQRKISVEKPTLVYGKIGKRIKELLKDISKEDIIRCLKNAMNDNWIIQKGYALNIILSDSQINRFLNMKTENENQTETNGIIGAMQTKEDREAIQKLIDANKKEHDEWDIFGISQYE